MTEAEGLAGFIMCGHKLHGRKAQQIRVIQQNNFTPLIDSAVECSCLQLNRDFSRKENQRFTLRKLC